MPSLLPYSIGTVWEDSTRERGCRMGESLRAISVAGYRYRPDLSSSRMDSSLVGKLWLTCSLDTELLAIIAFGKGGQEDELRKPVMALGFLRRSIYGDKSRPESGHW